MSNKSLHPTLWLDYLYQISKFLTVRCRRHCIAVRRWGALIKCKASFSVAWSVRQPTIYLPCQRTTLKYKTKQEASWMQLRLLPLSNANPWAGILATFLIVLAFTQSGIDIRDCFTLVKPKVYEVILKVDTRLFCRLGWINTTAKMYA